MAELVCNEMFPSQSEVSNMEAKMDHELILAPFSIHNTKEKVLCRVEIFLTLHLKDNQFFCSQKRCEKSK